MLQRVICHDSPSKIFCLTVPKNFAEEPFCAVFQKTSGSENVYGKEGGECQNFPLEIFCLKVPKNFVGEPFSLSLNSSFENFYASEGCVTIFCRNFLSHSAEKFRRGTLLCCAPENFW